MQHPVPKWRRSSSSPSSATAASFAPVPGFLESGCAACADRCGALLIFDEVMTGFRVAPGGRPPAIGVRPDLTCLGKVIGGGLPAAAYGGRRDVMQLIAPIGPMYQAGTLSGQSAGDGGGRGNAAGAHDGRLYGNRAMHGGAHRCAQSSGSAPWSAVHRGARGFDVGILLPGASRALSRGCPGKRRRASPSFLPRRSETGGVSGPIRVRGCVHFQRAHRRRHRRRRNPSYGGDAGCARVGRRSRSSPLQRCSPARRA
jgi:hypothetical protein